MRPVEASLIHADRRTDMTRQVRQFVDHSNTNTKTVVVSKYCNLSVEQILFTKRHPSYFDFFTLFQVFVLFFTAFLVTLPSAVA